MAAPKTNQNIIAGSLEAQQLSATARVENEKRTLLEIFIERIIALFRLNEKEEQQRGFIIKNGQAHQEKANQFSLIRQALAERLPDYASFIQDFLQQFKEFIENKTNIIVLISSFKQLARACGVADADARVENFVEAVREEARNEMVAPESHRIEEVAEQELETAEITHIPEPTITPVVETPSQAPVPKPEAARTKSLKEKDMFNLAGRSDSPLAQFMQAVTAMFYEAIYRDEMSSMKSQAKFIFNMYPTNFAGSPLKHPTFLVAPPTKG